MRSQPLRDDFALPVGDRDRLGIGGYAIPEGVHIVELFGCGELVEAGRGHCRERHGGEYSVVGREDHARYPRDKPGPTHLAGRCVR